MKINYILYTLILCVSLGLSALIYKKNDSTLVQKLFDTPINPGLVRHFNLDTITFDELTTAHDFTQWLAHQEQEVWVEIKIAFGFTQEEFQKRKNELAQDYNESVANMKTKYNSGKQLDSTTIAYVQAIMKEFNVDISKVELVAWNENLPASALDTIVFINEEMFQALEPYTKKFIIGHELIHVINKDHSTRYCLRNTTPLKELHDDGNNPFNKLCAFHELRADILCNIKGTEYAQGAAQFMKDQRAKFGDFATHGYPTYTLRETIGIKIAALGNPKSKIA